MSTIELKVKGTGYGGVPSGMNNTHNAQTDGAQEDRVCYRTYTSWGRQFEVRNAYLNASIREHLSAMSVGFQSEDECRTAAYFLQGPKS